MRVFKCVTPIYIKGLIRHQILCDYILAPKRYSYTQGYLREVQIEIFHCTSANQGELNEKCCGNTSRKRVSRVSLELLQTFTIVAMPRWKHGKKCFPILLETTGTRKKRTNLITLIIKMYILFVWAINTSTAGASSVFLSSYANTTFNQSERVFS